ncbi:hypothetical protein GCM10022379_38990 [Micromonospora maritima]
MTQAGAGPTESGRAVSILSAAGTRYADGCLGSAEARVGGGGQFGQRSLLTGHSRAQVGFGALGEERLGAGSLDVRATGGVHGDLRRHAVPTKAVRRLLRGFEQDRRLLVRQLVRPDDPGVDAAVRATAQ